MLSSIYLHILSFASKASSQPVRLKSFKKSSSKISVASNRRKEGRPFHTWNKRIDPSHRSLTGARAKGGSIRRSSPQFSFIRDASPIIGVHLEIVEWQPRWNFLGEEFRSLLDTVQECSSLSRVWHNGEIQSTALLYQYIPPLRPLFPPSASSFNQTTFLTFCKRVSICYFLSSCLFFPFHFLNTSERRWMGDCLNYSDWYIFQPSYRFVVDLSSLFESELDSFTRMNNSSSLFLFISIFEREWV